MKKKTLGIVLLVLGILAVIGGAANGTFAAMSVGAELSDIVTVVLMIALIVGGIVLIAKSKKGGK